MRPNREIEIVGGGLAGLALGLALRRADVPATLFEAGQYPRHRVCGEFIAGLDEATIGTLGLGPFLAGARRHHEVAWIFGNGPVQRRQRLPEPALGISRHRLDAALAAAFAEAGGRLHAGTRVADTQPREGRVLCTGRRRANPGWMGLKFHVRGLRLASDLELHLGDQCYVGLAPIEDDRVNVCGLFGRRPLCAKGPNLLLGYLQAAGLTALAQRLTDSVIDPTSFCSVAGVDFDAGIATGMGPSLGDAAGVMPPFTGNGMAMAFQSAASALPHLQDYARGGADWTKTSERIARELATRFNRRLHTAALLHPWILRPARQRWLRAAAPLGFPPLRPLYALLH
jgi:flavin-dependent dehydrogenase